MHRSDQLTALRNSPELSVLVIGGGINGIGSQAGHEPVEREQFGAAHVLLPFLYRGCQPGF